MKDGFIRVSSISSPVIVADCNANYNEMIKEYDLANKNSVNLVLYPELSLTGATCQDLFYSHTLIECANEYLIKFKNYTKNKYTIAVIGLPFIVEQKLYNCAAVISNGKILALIPKKHLSQSETRFFSSAPQNEKTIIIDGDAVSFYSESIFCCAQFAPYSFGVVIGNSLLLENGIAQNSSIVLNMNCCPQIIGKTDSVLNKISAFTREFNCSLVYSESHYTESTQDYVFGALKNITETGTALLTDFDFSSNNSIISEVDVLKIASLKLTNKSKDYCNINKIEFSQEIIKHDLVRSFSINPFIPTEKRELIKRIESILKIQAYALKKRLEHTKAKTVVIGISGGLDSTLALISAVNTMKLLNRPISDIIAVTMPCFGTTKRTKSNAVKLCECYGITVKEIDISKSVKQHFKDIGQDETDYNVTFENAQARERTQVLMDIANMTGGLVLGTGDLSELVLGWATYNGDHMSMYSINADIPKTMIKHIINYVAVTSESKNLNTVLLDILDTPVSPELVPANEKGEINQKTEDLVGPYQLHDFFLYYYLRYGFTPSKIFRLAKISFNKIFDDETIIKWLEVFFRRLFNQQFKRSCLPDGPSIGTVGVSPRTALSMPTDASSNLWLNEIENIKKMCKVN